MENIIKESINENLNNHIIKYIKKQSKKTNKEQQELSYLISQLTENESNSNIENNLIKKYSKKIKVDNPEKLSKKELITQYNNLETKNENLLNYMKLTMQNPEISENVKNRYVDAICNPYTNRIGNLCEEDLDILRKYNHIIPSSIEDIPNIKTYERVMDKVALNIILVTAKRSLISNIENNEEIAFLKNAKKELTKLKKDYIAIQLKKAEVLAEEKEIINRITELTENYSIIRNNKEEYTVNSTKRR